MWEGDFFAGTGATPRDHSRLAGSGERVMVIVPRWRSWKRSSQRTVAMKFSAGRSCKGLPLRQRTCEHAMSSAAKRVGSSRMSAAIKSFLKAGKILKCCQMLPLISNAMFVTSERLTLIPAATRLQ